MSYLDETESSPLVLFLKESSSHDISYYAYFEFEVKISLYMLISPHIVSHYSLVGLITYFEDAGL